MNEKQIQEAADIITKFAMMKAERDLAQQQVKELTEERKLILQEHGKMRALLELHMLATAKDLESSTDKLLAEIPNR